MMYVYMLRAGDSHYKIGVTTNVEKRVAGIQTSNANKVEIVTTIFSKNAIKVEEEIHIHLSSMRTNGGSEWFKLNPQEAVDLAVYINHFFDKSLRSELDDKVVLHELLKQNKVWKKSLEKKIDHVANAYQKGILRAKNVAIKNELGEPHRLIEPVEKVTDNDLLEKARKICWEANRASASLLQYKLKIGYARAARIMQVLEDEGFVSKSDGARARTILQEIY